MESLFIMPKYLLPQTYGVDVYCNECFFMDHCFQNKGYRVFVHVHEKTPEEVL